MYVCVRERERERERNLKDINAKAYIFMYL